MANGRSAALVSRMAFPLSQVSALAKISKFCSILSAIFSSILLRSVAEETFQLAAASQAASIAFSISSAVDLGILVKDFPSTGDVFSKYSPLVGATHLPPIKFSYWFLNVGF